MSDPKRADLVDAAHLVVGELAAGELKQANPHWCVVPLLEDWSVGPILHDHDKSDGARRAFWEELYAATGIEDTPASDRPSRHIGSGQPVVIWLGRCAQDRISALWLVDRLCRGERGRVFYTVDAPETVSILRAPQLMALLRGGLQRMNEAWIEDALVSWEALCGAPMPSVRWHRRCTTRSWDDPLPYDRPWRSVLGVECFGDDGAELDPRLLLALDDE